MPFCCLCPGNLSNNPPINFNLSGMTKAQLLDYADENGIDGVSSSMRKADILETIEGALA